MKIMDKNAFLVVPSIRRLNDLDIALKSTRKVILLTDADIANLKPLTEKVHAAGKKVWVNLELLGGFGRDQVGMKLLKNYYKVDGVMSTDNTRLRMARNASLFTVQRFLISDSRGLETAMRLMTSMKVDAAEILPASAAIEIFPELKGIVHVPVLAGGFVKTKKQVATLREAGFAGITTSRPALWQMTTK